VVAGGAGCDEMGPPQEELFAQCTLDWSVESDKFVPSRPALPLPAPS
jgi:hypothetical protein